MPYYPPTDEIGQPKTITSTVTVPDEYQYEQIDRLVLTGTARLVLQGTADFYVTDDFQTRSRIVLAGRG